MAKNNIASFKIDTNTYRFLGANEKANKKYVWADEYLSWRDARTCLIFFNRTTKASQRYKGS